MYKYIEGEHRRHQVLQRHARELVYEVSRYIRSEAFTSVPNHDVVNVQEHTAEY
jgi:hypothetical protein